MSEHKKKKGRRSSRESSGGLPAWLRASLIALPLSLLVGVLLLALGTALLLSTKDPNRYYSSLALPILYLTAFLGGVIATRLSHRRAAFLCGLLEGLSLCLFFALAALFMPNSLATEGTGYIKFLLRLPVIPSAMVGAFLAAKQATPRRRRHR